ncbi:hypothetical protein MHM88_11280 [Epibacterium sp. MM17-32]|uniref:hypothetical protein n=1 Tax=Epibacterium sp. MM17-32 TaxID=2917734 RepID=UPI001EF6598A|nr:hypothetical protein [Epibacterium sp. MM17-32]MCG7628390.1 hypothetical protein [Epibacterium sp. MM17-32]
MAVQNPTPTTELEAVNQMLRGIGESPVSSLIDDYGLDVPDATGTLSEISNAVQLEGWIFNTEYDYPLPVNVDGEIHVPSNALNVDFDWRTCGGSEPVVRGRRVYDRKGHTYKLDRGLKAKIIFGLPFEELPEAARYYITYRACRKFQDTQAGSNDLHRFSEADELRARWTFIEQHSDDQDLNMLRDTPEFSHLR